MPTTMLQPYLTAISVSNVDTLADWYRRILSFTHRKRMEFPEYELRIVFMERDGFLLELVEKRKSASLTTRLPDLEDDVFVWGFKKLAFLVGDACEFAASLKAAGVKILFDVTEQEDWPGGKTKSFIIEDPDGNWIQFYEKCP